LRLLVLLAGAGGVGAVGYLGLLPSWGGSTDKTKPLSVAVSRGTLRIVVTERGNLESVKTVDGVCELAGYQNKIIQLTPEGNHVEKGEIVCRFDSAEIDKNIAQQEIKAKQAASKIETSLQEVEIAKNKGATQIDTAVVELTLGELDLEMYQKGTYLAETEKIQGDIGLKKKDYEEAKNQLEQIQGLVKKGFKTPNDLRVAETQAAGKELALKGAMTELMVKQKYEYKRKSTEFSSKVDQFRKKVEQARAETKASVSKAESEYEAAKATFTIEDQQLKEFRRQKEKTVIKAEQAGIVAYANEPYFDSSRQIREGATVYSRQKIFSLPDMSSMQVKVSIHESLIKKIKPGQTAEIRVDAFPNIVVIGKVKTVSQLADSNRNWLSGGVKEYSTVVNIEDAQGRAPAGDDVRGQNHGRRGAKRPPGPGPGRRPAQGEVLRLRGDAPGGGAPRGQGRRHQRIPGPDRRGAERRRLRQPRRADPRFGRVQGRQGTGPGQEDRPAVRQPAAGRLTRCDRSPSPEGDSHVQKLADSGPRGPQPDAPQTPDAAHRPRPDLRGLLGDRDARDRRGGEPGGPAPDRRVGGDQHHPEERQARRRREPVETVERELRL